MDFDSFFSRRLRGSAMPDHGLRRIGSPDMIQFGGGLPDPALHPAAELRRLFDQILAANEGGILGYGYEQGDAVLRELIAYRHRKEGGSAGADGVVLTNGSAGGIGLVAAALVDPGDVVIAEAATYPGALKAFRQMGAEIVATPIDVCGLDPTGLEAALKELDRDGRRAKFLYTIPTCHNPTATVLSLERRQAVADLAERHGLLIVEDNTYGDIRFGPTPPPLIALAPDRTIHLGSFSKTIAPGLRVGWAAGPDEIAAGLARMRTDLGISPLIQRVVTRFIEDGTFTSHLAHVTKHYRRKRDAMLASLERHCVDVAQWSDPEGGFFVWLTIPHGDVGEVLDAAEQEKVSFIPGTYFAATPGACSQSLRLSYGEIAEDRIDEGLRRLGRALAAVVKPDGRRRWR
ncbi:MAG: PLP-dependent aminotransferase family protein [Novosphingobium sp.]|nr:PLP-dependent aminotransferase family protein [Novosphingobium sp.]MCP5403397.1 PLP-dependent aminotransferase family protein [Novosphingobium sp.]